MRSPVRFAALAIVLLALAPATFADDYSDGRALYKAGKYAEAAAKLEHAVKQNPNDGKSWWQLNFAYHKLNRDSDALKAVQKAGQTDAKHTFASEPGKYEQILGQRQRETGQTARATANPANPPVAATTPEGGAVITGETSAGSGSGTIVQQLLNGHVYVERG